MDGFLNVVPELIKTNGDDHYLCIDPPGNDCFNFLLITQQGCPACDRFQQTLREMQRDTNLDFPAIVYCLDTSPRHPNDVNHAITMATLNVINIPTLYLVTKRKRLIPFPMTTTDGAVVPHLINLTKADIYNTWMN